jgi:hypothetical protein
LTRTLSSKAESITSSHQTFASSGKEYEDYPKKEFKSYGEYFYEMLARCVRVTAAKVVIIDDLALLRRGRDHNGQAAGLLQRLRELKDKEGLSIRVIARSPTRATMRGMVTLADLLRDQPR